MLSCLRLSIYEYSRSCLKQRLPVSARLISSTLPARYSDSIQKEQKSEDIDGDDAPDVDNPKVQSYRDFLERVAKPFKYAKERNWLGGDRPFPLNPSFRPPPPISDAQRDLIYARYCKGDNVMTLSSCYNISRKRVDAILRLKELERSWIKGKELQTGFQFGMEKVLGVPEFKTSEIDKNKEPSRGDQRYDVHEADMLEQDEKRDQTPQRYQRLYWETVAESGAEPIVPLALQHAESQAATRAKLVRSLKSSQELMPRVHNPKLFPTSAPSSFVRSPNHAPIQFVDVGGKFMDVNDRLDRLARAQRRSKRRARRAVQRQTPPHTS